MDNATLAILFLAVLAAGVVAGICWVRRARDDTDDPTFDKERPLSTDEAADLQKKIDDHLDREDR